MSLVLTRRVGESIIIDDKIEITVTLLKKAFGSATDGGHVRLMIHAPGLSIERREIWEDKHQKPFPGAANRHDNRGNK